VGFEGILQQIPEIALSEDVHTQYRGQDRIGPFGLGDMVQSLQQQQGQQGSQV